MKQEEHIPVLAEPIAEMINLSPGSVVVDATIGHGGHSKIFARSLDSSGTIVGIDVDPKSLAAAKETLTGHKCRVLYYRANFAEISDVFDAAGIEKADLIFADLGICSAQLVDPERGLSFQLESKLDMRLDDRIKATAADIVNKTDEKGLADLIFLFGQERASRKIARSIVHYRKTKKITTTAELAMIICRAMKIDPLSRKSKIHPATKTFQALRIAVNQELKMLQNMLDQMPKLLKPGGRAAVISFHSLEDRIVKHDFRQKALAGEYNIVTKKPLVASQHERDMNPRSRSAKLRIAEKI